MADTTDRDIPEDVRFAAADAGEEVRRFPSATDWIIARAILAERERTAARLDRVEGLLKRAGEALEPFAEFGENNTDDLGWTNNNCKNDRVCDWLGPTAFRDARTVANEVKEALK